ncbi:ATP-dependent dethiobiotin synthetase BioD [Paraferrimonas haliotis]|uniref:ATP-dependent dethiobiotin synthetase BioD n=1 Tax=Paraferrimonas haliotis TaxID=2013866 RepID=A0AA37WXL8_9GAMM|nr:ATP-dependent dethiobiotin synthetase BioD [Paraferrimonas haliotis]
MIYFVTGTDTDAGKTLISEAMLRGATGSTLGLKPIASGCEQSNDGLRNADAQALMSASSVELDYKQVNPFAFEPAIAPHIAAEQAGVAITCQALNDAIPVDAMMQTDFVLVEGAGGWLLPISHGQTLDQWVAKQQWPVILVVGIKLGCLNHAMLTIKSIETAGLTVAGWVGNQLDPDMEYAPENIAYLKANIKAPCLGVVPYLQRVNAQAASAYIDLSLLD